MLPNILHSVCLLSFRKWVCQWQVLVLSWSRGIDKTTIYVICVCGEAEVLVGRCSASGPKLMVLETYGDDCTLSVRCHEHTKQFNRKFGLLLANAKQHSKDLCSCGFCLDAVCEALSSVLLIIHLLTTSI